MSEKFEVPPEHSRILSSPYTPSQPWSKIIIAFAAGLACAVLVITATFVWPRGNSDSAKVTAESSRIALAKKATTPPPKATDGSAQRDEAQPADTSDDLAALRAAAAATAGAADTLPGAAKPDSAAGATAAGPRGANLLNPEISATGDVRLFAQDEGTESLNNQARVTVGKYDRVTHAD